MSRILLFAVALILSYFTAPYLGKVYDYFVPQLGSSFLGIGKEVAVYVVGFPFSYVFFTSFRKLFLFFSYSLSYNSPYVSIKSF